METFASAAISSRIQFVDSPASIWLADGTSVVFRPMRSEDARQVVEMHNRLSADSIYFRYLHPYKPTFEEVESLAQLDGVNGAAFVAAVEEAGEEKVIGLGFYRTDPRDRTTGQPAFLVEDQYQNQGVGRVLARLVTQRARTNGVRVLDTLVHPENRRMMHLIEASGFSYEAKLSYGAYELHVSLQEPGSNQ